ncbi:MAG: hypothetical protein FWD63_00580 [Propionibacteriaceae bacterium]|nr:hypothetical protein [Propionibacteriaceae bacterium]
MNVAQATAHEVAYLWRAIAATLRARGWTILLLLTLGWVGYNMTVFIAGFVAPMWAWAVIPIMGAGCLVQLIVTLAAYRTVIEFAQANDPSTQLPHLSLVPLLSTMLVPFAAAYSAYGFFTGYARDTVIAAGALVGTFADAAFLGDINPLASVTTMVICVAVFVLLWVAARVIKAAAGKTASPVLSVISAFVSSCNTFLMLFSIFRLSSYAHTWAQTRAFMQWRDTAIAWLTGLIHINVADIVMLAWHWLTNTAWPMFWYALSQPILWLAVVALVGGMQFVNVDTVWSGMRTRLGIREHEIITGVTKQAGRRVISSINNLLPFFHLLSVILRSGAPFLAVLIVSYAAVDQCGAWLSMLVKRTIGPIPQQYVFAVNPALQFVGMVVTPGVLAVLLAAAYVRLRRHDTEMKLARVPFSWRTLVVALVGIGMAIGVTLVVPGSPNRQVALTPDTPATVMDATVTISDVRVGRQITGVLNGQTVTDPISSVGLFVAVNVTVTSHGASSVQIAAQSGEVTYPSWDGFSAIANQAGFTTSRDLVFEIPSDGISDVSVTISPNVTLSSTIAVATYQLPANTAIATVIRANELPKSEVP